MTGYAAYPLTADRWDDLEALFGPSRGGVSGCWCMFFRLTRQEWTAAGRDGRKAAFRALVETGPPPGLLAYAGAMPVGWCAIAPREATPQVAKSRVGKPVDSRPVWSITCFYIDRHHRRQGVMRALIDAALVHAAKAGATLVEAYPLEEAKSAAWGGGYVGFADVFRSAGFVETARRTPNRPLMRRDLG